MELTLLRRPKAKFRTPDSGEPPRPSRAFGIYGFSVLFDVTGADLPLFAIGGAPMILGAGLAAPVLARLVAGPGK